MEDVTELYPDGKGYRTVVWITEKGRKERSKLVPPDLEALFEINADKGFQGYRGDKLRDEGQGVWAFGTRTWTTRIAGYFTSDNRSTFVVGGVWEGKAGKGNARPHSAEAVVARVARLRSEGVNFVQKPQES